MKLTFLLLTVAMMHVSAKGLSQNITFTGKDVPLLTVFSAIEKQTGYVFFYNNRDMVAAKPVTLTLYDATLEFALDECLKNHSLQYVIKEKTIFIKSKPKSAGAFEPQVYIPSPLIEVRGIITDEKGNPLAGANIKVKGTNQITTTNSDGIFVLKNVDKDGELEISFVGFKTKTIRLSGNSAISIMLEPTISALTDVVVIGYGTQRKSDLTGSVSSVGAKDFTKGVQTNALQLINGKAAGVQISQASSAPGGGLEIKIRGAGSINSSNNPLIVIDGMPAADPQAIDPNDIQSIEVLKDASSSAIYGTRAANGVVLITTKKGSGNHSGLTYSSYVGVQNVAKRIDVLKGNEYMDMVNTVAVGNGRAPVFSPAQIAAVGEGTDWQDELFKGATVQNHSISFTGASEKSDYYIGLNYFDQNGVVKSSGFQKYGIRLNYNLNPLPKLKIKFNTSIQKALNRSILISNFINEGAGPINASLEYDPTISAQKNADGTYPSNPSIALSNPMALIDGNIIKSVDNRIYGTITTDYALTKDITATLRLGYDQDLLRNDNYEKRLTLGGIASNGIGSVGTSESYHWLAEYFTTYSKNIKNVHRFTALGGITFENTFFRSVGAGARQFPNDDLTTNFLQSGAISTFTVNSFATESKTSSFLGRINYTYSDKYLLTATLRADGTSRFSEAHKYALFPSVAVGWRLINEKFLHLPSLFNDLKVRFSYGELGNQAIDNYQTLQTFGSSGTAILNDRAVTGVEPLRLANSDLRWETTSEYNYGLDFGLFGNRITGSIEYYTKKTGDQLFRKPVPASTGFTQQLVNFGSVVNKGWDILLNTQNLQGNFKWNSSIALSTLTNKVTSLPDYIPTPILAGSIGTFSTNYAIVNVGNPIYALYGYNVEGIFNSTDEIARSAQKNSKPGDIKFSDLDGNGIITPSDRTVLGSPFPKYTVGFGNNFSYKNFHLNMMVNVVQDVSTIDANIIQSLYPINPYRNKISYIWHERWTPSNPGGKYPAQISSANYGGALSINSLDIVDASYVRLQNVTLSYDFTVGNKRVIKSLTTYIAGDNLVTITRFKGFNPEADDKLGSVEKASFNSYPLSRVLRIGITASF